MRKVNYKEKGITLIALVVTIIILLILAGVTLTTALSQNGLFQRAKIVVEKYKEAEADEAEKLGEVEKELDKIIDGETPPDPPKKPDPVEVTEKNLKEFQGKYVDIGLDTNDNKEVDDWEIFYVNEGRIFLIAVDYVPVSQLSTWGVMKALNDTGFQRCRDDYEYNVNWNMPETFLEEGLADLNLVKHTTYDLKDNRNKVNSIAVSHLLNTTAWNGVKTAASADKQQYIDFVIGGSTLEMWCEAWNVAVDGDETLKRIRADGSGTSGYYVGCEATNHEKEEELYVNGSIDSAVELTKLDKYETFFPHTAQYESCDGYWLASPSAEVNPGCLMYVRFDGGVKLYATTSGWYLGVRPVVSLESGVRIVKREGANKIYDVIM